MNRMARIVPDPNRTYACTRTAVQLCGSHRYTDRPPTRLHTKWHGPYCIVSFKGSEYVLANLVNHKKRSVHVKNLKIFNYDPEVEYRSMLNGSTTMILIIHGSRGNHYGSVKHSMIIYVIIK